MKKGDTMVTKFSRHIQIGLIYVLFLSLNQQAIALETKKGRGCYAVSIPKCGTGLLTKLITSMQYKFPKFEGKQQNSFPEIKDGEYIVAHANFSDRFCTLAADSNFRVVGILRDPRDAVVSMYYYFGKGYATQLGIPFEEKNTLITAIIKNWYAAGDRAVQSRKSLHGSMTAYYKAFLDWQKCPNAYLTTYEKLVGPKGGGDAAVQRKEIRNIANFLELPLTEEEMTNIISKLYGGSGTFRNGKIGSWKTEFTKEHVALFKAVGQDLLMELGYEKDDSWNIDN